jgi:UDP-N-acetylglucosamine/UDP-N-acetylgalactosamine 4-epimerase
VFGKNQDPNGAYAAVIPLWVKKLINHESPVINGDGTYSRDFTFIDNVIQANEKAASTPTNVILKNLKMYYHKLEAEQGIKFATPEVVMEIFNVAYGGNTTLLGLFDALKENLAIFDKEIDKIKPIIGPKRQGDIPHSQATINKAKTIINYNPKYNAPKGLEMACGWYWDNLKIKTV